MKMKPIGDNILIREEKQKEKTASGIIMPTGHEEYSFAKVIATGPGLFTQTGDTIPMTIKVGDTVMYPSFITGDQKKITLDGTKYYLLRESEISMVSTDE